MSNSLPTYLIGTKKGGFALRPNGDASTYKVEGPFKLGSPVHDFRVDPRDGRTLLMTAGGSATHLGPTIMRSVDGGASWTETSEPPKFDPVANEGDEPWSDGTTRGLAVKSNFWLQPGHASEPGVWYCGTVPQGLFRSEDHGDTWTGVNGFNHHPKVGEWTFKATEVPDGPFMHSILVDPRDADHLFLSMSVGGTFESHDKGATWTPRNENVFVAFSPESYPEFGQDPHQMIQHPADPDVYYQQNHCGFYVLDRRGKPDNHRWERVGDNLPEEIGDIGFGVAPHPTEADTAWNFPMDGTDVWPRTSPGAKPACYRTDDAGQTWRRQDNGLPAEHAYWTVRRQCFSPCGDAREAGVVFGTTNGQVWRGLDGGERFVKLADHLPLIQSVRVAHLDG